MSRLTLFFVTALVAIALLPSAASASSCSIRGKERKLGPTYTTRLVVSHVSCKTGQRFVTSYYRCRRASGGADGRCHKRISGYKCTERRRNRISTQFDATVTCKRGSRRITHDYEQFT